MALVLLVARATDHSSQLPSLELTIYVDVKFWPTMIQWIWCILQAPTVGSVLQNCSSKSRSLSSLLWVSCISHDTWHSCTDSIVGTFQTVKELEGKRAMARDALCKQKWWLCLHFLGCGMARRAAASTSMLAAWQPLWLSPAWPGGCPFRNRQQQESKD